MQQGVAPGLIPIANRRLTVIYNGRALNRNEFGNGNKEQFLLKKSISWVPAPAFAVYV